MKLTVVGCSGSFAGPDSAASCYLVEHEGFSLVIDLGSGALGPLQAHVDLRDIDAILLSHLHPDHCQDFTGLYVVAKYHPDGQFDRIPVWAPGDASAYFARVNGPESSTMDGQFAFSRWTDAEPVTIGPFTVTAYEVSHPVPAVGMRIEAGGEVLAYSGDSGPTPVLTDIARGAGLFLCEASFVESGTNPPELHLTGAEAGQVAKDAGVGELLITHIPPWTDRAEVARLHEGDVFDL